MDVVFSGVVEAISAEDYFSEVTFKVLESWKGITGKQVTVLTSWPDGCGYPFEKDSCYLVYAHYSEPSWIPYYCDGCPVTGICHRTGSITGVTEDLQYLNSLDLDEWFSVPKEYWLFQNYPNPFNPVSTIRYDLPQATEVTLVVYDILGREVARLVDGLIEPGYHQAQWNGRNQLGHSVPSGIYIARLVTTGYSKAIKMVLLK
ncbi:MAG: T9SS type A sorting domain-containing protein [Fidelibacterota bacterium]|nr:MAG: T9SS type A sorting domain-containing protein [Candidatus Neomarinimicrobiota bacterium]